MCLLVSLCTSSRGHYNDVTMSAMASQITSLAIVYSAVYSRRRSNKTSKLCVTGHRWPVNSPHKGPITRNMLPFDGVTMGEKHFLHESILNNIIHAVQWQANLIVNTRTFISYNSHIRTSEFRLTRLLPARVLANTRKIFVFLPEMPRRA